MAEGEAGARAVQVDECEVRGADGAVWSPDAKRLRFVVSVYPECSVKGGGGPTHHDEAVMNRARSFAGVEAKDWACGG